MPDLKTILTAKPPLTLAGVPTGFLPSLLADLARAAPTRACSSRPTRRRCARSRRPRRSSRPSWRCVTFPAWDCLPYDRASPTLRVMAERDRGAAPAAGASATSRSSSLTTANAATQRVLTPFRIRQLVATLAPGERIGRDKLAALLQANGYVRTDTVHDQGEYAVRGGIVDLFP